MVYGGKKFEFLGVRFAKEAMKYNNATVHRDARLTVRNEEGHEGEVEMFGSILELDGKYKVFSYIYK
jgi:hypothetical protein